MIRSILTQDVVENYIAEREYPIKEYKIKESIEVTEIEENSNGSLNIIYEVPRLKIVQGMTLTSEEVKGLVETILRATTEDICRILGAYPVERLANFFHVSDESARRYYDVYLKTRPQKFQKKFWRHLEDISRNA